MNQMFPGFGTTDSTDKPPLKQREDAAVALVDSWDEETQARVYWVLNRRGMTLDHARHVVERAK